MQDKKIAIITSVIPKANLAFQQNALPLITEIELKNSSETTYHDLELVLICTPAFLCERTWHIDKLAADSQVILDDELCLELVFNKLYRFSPVMKGKQKGLVLLMRYMLNNH